jgi:hypothetical protein
VTEEKEVEEVEEKTGSNATTVTEEVTLLVTAKAGKLN